MSDSININEVSLLPVKVNDWNQNKKPRLDSNGAYEKR